MAECNLLYVARWGTRKWRISIEAMCGIALGLSTMSSWAMSIGGFNLEFSSLKDEGE